MGFHHLNTTRFPRSLADRSDSRQKLCFTVTLTLVLGFRGSGFIWEYPHLPSSHRLSSPKLQLKASKPYGDDSELSASTHCQPGNGQLIRVLKLKAISPRVYRETLNPNPEPLSSPPSERDPTKEHYCSLFRALPFSLVWGPPEKMTNPCLYQNVPPKPESKCSSPHTTH